MEEMKLRTLSVLVDNEAGVLSQISRLFSRKGFNVESLAVGATDHPEISRMTIEVMANENQTNLMCNQLAKMVPVHSVKLLVPSHSIRRELVLYKVRAKNSEDKNEIIQIANIFRGLHHRRFQGNADPVRHRRREEDRRSARAAGGLWHRRAGADRYDRSGTWKIHHRRRHKGKRRI